MTDGRLARILAVLTAEASPPGGTRWLCEAVAEETATSGAGLILFPGEVPQRSLSTTDSTALEIDDLQFTFGEGPSIDAHSVGVPVLEPDLTRPEATNRWPAFAPPALAAGAGAVFGFPVRMGAARLGALSLYRDRPGALNGDQHAGAVAVAEIAAIVILALQANAPVEGIARELDSGDGFRYVVHQASGMVAVQLGVSVGEALVRLRAVAFGTDTPLISVAEDVVGRRWHFE